MDINLKSKDIIKKQQLKYSSTAWAEYFDLILNSEPYQSILKNLIDQAAKGNRFRPSIKEIFEYTNNKRSPKDIKVVMICNASIHPAETYDNILVIDPDPIKFNNKIDWDCDKLYDMWHWEKPVWAEFITETIKFFDKPGVTFIFESNEYNKYKNAVDRGKMCIIPERNHSIYKNNYHAIWHRIVKNIQ